LALLNCQRTARKLNNCTVSVNHINY